MLQGDSNSFVSCFNWLKYNTLFSAVILECDMVMSLSSVSQHLISKTMDYFSTTLVLFQKGEVTLEALSQIRASVKQRSYDCCYFSLEWHVILIFCFKVHRYPVILHGRETL